MICSVVGIIGKSFKKFISVRTASLIFDLAAIANTINTGLLADSRGRGKCGNEMT